MRVFGATTSVASLAAFLALSCANGNGSQIIGGTPDGSLDGTMGTDGTIHSPDTGAPTRDAGRDTAPPGFDSFVPPTPDATPDVHVVPPIEAGFDGGLVFFGNPGTPCATLGATQLQACGICGTQTSQCIVRPDGGVPFDAGRDAAPDATLTVDAGSDTGTPSDAAGHDATSEVGPDAHAPDAAKDATKDAAKDAGPDLVWGEWGTCTGQLSPDAGCLPGTQMTVSCGICGTQTMICEPDCEFGVTNCVGQIDGGCSPGSSTFTPNPACDGGFAGNQQVCSSTCQLEAPQTCVTPPSTLTVPTTLGSEIYTFVDFVASVTDPLVSAGFTTNCSFDPTTPTPYAFITLVNPNPTQTATVSVVTYQVAGQPQLDVAVGLYPKIPTSTAGLKSCTTAPTDSCTDTDPLACETTYGGLTVSSFDPVVIPAGGSVAVFFQDQINDAIDLGIVQVGVRTESFP